MPLLLSELSTRDAGGPNFKNLRVKAMGCAGLIGEICSLLVSWSHGWLQLAIAGGLNIFRPDSYTLIELLIRIQSILFFLYAIFLFLTSYFRKSNRSWGYYPNFTLPDCDLGQSVPSVGPWIRALSAYSHTFFTIDGECKSWFISVRCMPIPPRSDFRWANRLRLLYLGPKFLAHRLHLIRSPISSNSIGHSIDASRRKDKSYLLHCPCTKTHEDVVLVKQQSPITLPTLLAYSSVYLSLYSTFSFAMSRLRIRASVNILPSYEIMQQISRLWCIDKATFTF